MHLRGGKEEDQSDGHPVEIGANLEGSVKRFRFEIVSTLRVPLHKLSTRYRLLVPRKAREKTRALWQAHRRGKKESG